MVKTYFITAFLSIFILLPFSGFSQQHACIDEIEQSLYNHINKIRKENNMKAIPLSKSLSYVADVHAKDLHLNYSHSKECSMHSWSKNGRWKSCPCENKSIFKCMTAKPRELTSYKGNGYELVCYMNKEIDVKTIFNTWRKQTSVLNIILQRETYATKKWKAMGVGIYNGFVCVWFGETPENEMPEFCSGTAPEEIEIETPPIQDTFNSKSTVSDKNMPFYIVFASHNSQPDADKELKEIQKQTDISVYITKHGGRYRITSKRFATNEEAMSLKRTIEKKFPNAWIYTEK